MKEYGVDSCGMNWFWVEEGTVEAGLVTSWSTSQDGIPPKDLPTMVIRRKATR